MALYVCFNDSINNPTYSDIDSVFLVESDEKDGNPCAIGKTKREVALLPKDAIDIEQFASLMGWGFETDNDGQIVLYTGVNKGLHITRRI